MILSKRLKAIADYIKPEIHLADIGTDHAYLPIYLASEKHMPHILAMDVNKGPLAIAKKNIEEQGFENAIELRLSNGLVELKEEDHITGVSIAGMGGFLIRDILTNDLSKLEEVTQMVLQPQSDYEVVRKTVHELGFTIHDEVMLQDANKYYVVLNCLKGMESYDDNIYYKYGKKLIEKKDETFIAYLEHRVSKNKMVLQRLEGSENNEQRYDEVKAEVEEMEALLHVCNR